MEPEASSILIAMGELSNRQLEHFMVCPLVMAEALAELVELCAIYLATTTATVRLEDCFGRGAKTRHWLRGEARRSRAQLNWGSQTLNCHLPCHRCSAKTRKLFPLLRFVEAKPVSGVGVLMPLQVANHRATRKDAVWIHRKLCTLNLIEPLSQIPTLGFPIWSLSGQTSGLAESMAEESERSGY